MLSDQSGENLTFQLKSKFFFSNFFSQIVKLIISVRYMQKQSWSWLLWLNDSCQPDQPHCYFAGGDVVRGIRLMLSPTNGLLEGKKSPQETNKGNFINSSLTDLSQLSSLVTKMRHFVLSPKKCSSTSWERFSLELDFDIVTSSSA